MDKYYELIVDLLEFYNHNKVAKEVIDKIPKEDIHAARRWVFQKQLNRP